MAMLRRQAPAIGVRPKDMLSLDQIEAAKLDRSHPVAQVFDSMAKDWQTLNRDLKSVRDANEQQWQCKLAFVPFSEAIEGLTFTLGPLDLVSIWAPVAITFPKSDYPGHAMATSIACAYATNPIEPAQWRRFFLRMSSSENSDEVEFLFKLARRDRKGALVFNERIAEIRASLQEVRYCMSGTRESTAAIMDRAYKQHDKDAKNEIYLAAAWQKEFKDEVLDSISENWGNALTWMHAP